MSIYFEYFNTLFHCTTRETWSKTIFSRNGNSIYDVINSVGSKNCNPVSQSDLFFLENPLMFHNIETWQVDQYYKLFTE